MTILGRLLVLGAVGAGMAAAAVHNIMVGASDHKFQPNSVTANIGDIISFQFYPTNHSVVRMDPAWPCKPYELVNPKDPHGGWWSGFQDVSTFMDPAPSWNLTVKTTDPVYFYCSAPSSCIEFQMVGVINVNNASYPISAVASKAGQTDYSLSPGETWQSESSSSGAPSTGSSPPSSTTSPAASNSDSVTVVISTGAIIGIVVGVIAVIALIGLGFYVVGRKKKKNACVKEAPGSIHTAGPEDGLVQMAEHPPVYNDPRYSQMPPADGYCSRKQQQHLSVAPNVGLSQHPNRISELPDTSYSPVEIYTPGPEDMPGHRQ